MIPLSSKEFVEYKDSDGMVWRFKPKSGSLEREQLGLWEEGMLLKDLFEKRDKFLEKIIISPKEEYLKADYNDDEKTKILKFWNDANRLTAEEKKS